MSTVRAAIIPHATKEWSGPARNEAFIRLPKDTERIIYLAANHQPTADNTTYLLHADDPTWVPAVDNLVRIPYAEHSYSWVEKELRERFTSAKILAIGPNGEEDDKLVDWILKEMKDPNTILIATTDLTHYGPRFNNVGLVSYPQQLGKLAREEQLIESLLDHPNPNTIKPLNDLMCGPYAIRTFAMVMLRLKFRGKVVDYYDSHGKGSNDKLDRYVIDSSPVESFVSYVSIVYGPAVDRNRLVVTDIMMAIGIVKSAVKRDLAGKKYAIRLPKWSPWYQMIQGVFVGSSVDGETNCSYGRYEGEGTSGEKIAQASGNCWEDANGRWRIPYTELTLPKTAFKVEVLQLKGEWREYPGNDAPKVFPYDGNHGMYLRLNDGRAATYLPVVARENMDWGIENYMRALTQKAGGVGHEWKEGVIEVYRSRSFIWDPMKQVLEM